jgi:hypothetical protein
MKKMAPTAVVLGSMLAVTYLYCVQQRSLHMMGEPRHVQIAETKKGQKTCCFLRMGMATASVLWQLKRRGMLPGHSSDLALHRNASLRLPSLVV